MRRSKTLEIIRNGGWVLSTAVSVGGARIAEMAGHIGFDCLWLDSEHKPCSQADIFNMILGARAADTDCVVRVRKQGYLDYFRALEDGAAGIMVPHVKTVDEAEYIASNAKYPPRGKRGIDMAGADCRYMLDGGIEAMEFANRETFVMIQIEDKGTVILVFVCGCPTLRDLPLNILRLEEHFPFPIILNGLPALTSVTFWRHKVI